MMNAKILIVEDDSSQAETLVFFLNKLGYITETATDGKEAETKVLSFVPTLILLDLFLPDTNGILLLKQLREDVLTAHIPVIVTTADTEDETCILSLSNGANDFLTKPIRMAELAVRIEKELDILHYKQELELLNAK